MMQFMSGLIAGLDLFIYLFIFIVALASNFRDIDFPLFR